MKACELKAHMLSCDKGNYRKVFSQTRPKRLSGFLFNGKSTLVNNGSLTGAAVNAKISPGSLTMF